MDIDPLAPLLQALQLTPDNVVLRAHVVREVLKSRRYKDVKPLGEPLLSTEYRPLGLLALARGELEEGRRDDAERHYKEAIAADSSLIDEGLEAELESDNRLKLTSTGEIQGEMEMPPVPSSVPRVTFQDIGGMEALKEQIRMNILYPMQKPEIYEAYGKKIGGGILLYGPPGCGKTHLARATAGELGANFFSLALNEILDMYIGNSEKNLAELFATARGRAPSVLFIDEVDAMGAKRGSLSSSGIRMMVSQFLTEMDGISSNNDKLLVLGATNEPWNVDTALRRPGRFDRVLFVPPPDAKARVEILKLKTAKRNVDPGIPWDKIAAQTELFSGADLAQLVEQATERAVADALRSGDLRPVRLADFQLALKERKASTTEWLRRSRNYVNFANQDGFYDDLSQFLEKAKIR
jgi:SpoVK/Ycf46/Vps4 family AAA+-type ATPase